jgi:hypothetical protein
MRSRSAGGNVSSIPNNNPTVAIVLLSNNSQIYGSEINRLLWADVRIAGLGSGFVSRVSGLVGAPKSCHFPCNSYIDQHYNCIDLGPLSPTGREIRNEQCTMINGIWVGAVNLHIRVGDLGMGNGEWEMGLSFRVKRGIWIWKNPNWSLTTALQIYEIIWNTTQKPKFYC